jgi:FtsZ-binding cell division protein ZapB
VDETELKEKTRNHFQRKILVNTLSLLFSDLEELHSKTQSELSNLAKRLSDLDRENIHLRRDREIQKQVISKQEHKIKDLKHVVEQLKQCNSTYSDNCYATDASHQVDKKFYPRARSSSQKRRKRGATQKRDRSAKPQFNYNNRLITLLQEVVGNADPNTVAMFPLEIECLQEEEKHYVRKMTQCLAPIEKQDINLTVLCVKSVARIQSLSKICRILKEELSLSNEKLSSITSKYQKAIEEGTESDMRLIQMQRDLSSSKSRGLNYTILPTKASDLETSQNFMSKKHSSSTKKLSHTFLSSNDTHLTQGRFLFCIK